MDLSNPSALWLLLLLIPLILAWKRRPKTTRAVGNVFLWQQVASASATSFVARLRRNWLLAAQVAFVLAATAALARPVLPLGGRTVAIILDLSASMGAREGASTRLDAAVARAIATVDSFPWNTRVRVIAARSVPEAIGEYLVSDPALRRAIRAQETTAGPADVPAAIDAARAEARIEPAETYVFSDGPPEASVQWVPIGTPVPNAAITKVAARRAPLSPRDGQVLVEAWNYSTAPLNTEIEVKKNGALVGRYPARLAARAGTTLGIDVPDVDGVISARLVADDALSVDNVRFAVLPSIKPVRVLLTGSSFFLEKALAANSTLVVERSRGASPPEVVVCAACSELPPDEGSVLFIPRASQPRAEAAVMMLTAPGHPIAAAVDLSGILGAPLALAAAKAVPRADSTTIARIAGQPAILASEINGRRVVELRVDVADANLAVSNAFPILIANAIDWLARRGENSRELVAGEPLHWVLRGQPTQGLEVIGPSGRSVSSFVAGSRLTSSSTHAAGVYVIRTGAAEETFVVNPTTASESDLSASPVQQPAATPASATSRVGQQVVTPLILLALALASAEWWLRCRAARRA